MTKSRPTTLEAGEPQRETGPTPTEGKAVMADSPIPPGMELFLKDNPAAMDSTYYVDTGEPLGTEIVRGLGIDGALSDRLSGLYALAVRKDRTGQPSEDHVERLIQRYYDRRRVGR
jgi:hypothetical protein